MDGKKLLQNISPAYAMMTGESTPMTRGLRALSPALRMLTDEPDRESLEQDEEGRIVVSIETGGPMNRANMGKEMMAYGGKTKAKKPKKMRMGGKTYSSDGCAMRGKTKAKKK